MRFKIFDILFANEIASKTYTLEKITDLQNQLNSLEEKYESLRQEVDCLKEESVELTNEIYRLENSLDARIDILAEHNRIIKNV